MKGGATYQNIKSNTVIKDPYTVSGMRWDDTDISGMQSVFDPCIAVWAVPSYRQRISKIHVHGEKQGYSGNAWKVRYCHLYHEKDRFLSYRDTRLQSEAPVHKAGVHKSFTVQCQAIFMKSLRMFLLLQIKCLIKSLIVVVGINIFLKFFSGKLHNCPLSMWLFHNS